MTLTTLSPSQTDAILSALYATKATLSRQVKAERKSFCPNQARIESLLTAKYETERDITEHQTAYERQPWSRYFLVTNSNGHIHSSTHCSTCFPTTTYAWLTELSGSSVGAVIEEFGEKVCTVCFPDAPSDPRHSQPGRRDREAQAARASEKAQRQSAKLAKALLPDGSALKVRVGGFEERVDTVVTAERLLVEALFQEYRGRDLRRGGSRIPQERLVEVERESEAAATVLAQALAAKRGTDENAVRRSVVEKVARKVKQWGREGRW
jgi:hypothetical protein